MTQDVETADRLRRIETKLTRYLESRGVPTNIRRPTFADGEIVLHTLDTSLSLILKVIPPDWDPEEPITLVHDGKDVLEIFIP